MGIGDGLCEAAEVLWDTIESYSYIESYKEELIDILTKMTFLNYKMDQMPGKEDTWTIADAKKHCLKRWSSRCCGKEFHDNDA